VTLTGSEFQDDYRGGGVIKATDPKTGNVFYTHKISNDDRADLEGLDEPTFYIEMPAKLRTAVVTLEWKQSADTERGYALCMDKIQLTSFAAKPRSSRPRTAGWARWAAPEPARRARAGR
jgi:hypothetical protein